MKTMVRCALIVGIATLLASPRAVPASVIKVYLMAGQSNMDGAGLVAQLGPPYNASQPAVQFWNWKTGSWGILQPGIGANTSAEFGPELGFGYAIHNAFPADDVCLVKYAVGATSLASDWRPDGGWCYANFRSVANAAINDLTAAGYSPELAGMLWMQGESDAGNGTASTYDVNLKNFIGRVRSDFAAPSMPFVIGRINAYAWGTPTNNALVREAQMTVPGLVGNASWINTDDLPLSYAGHFNSQGQITLGNRFAGEFMQTPEPQSIVTMLTGLFGFLAYRCWRWS